VSVHTCLDCRRYELAVHGHIIQDMIGVPPNQAAFEASMQPLGHKANRVKVRFA
jgi:hypothetical protein